MVEHKNRRFAPTSPASDRAGNAWDTWFASDRGLGSTSQSPRDAPLIASIDRLDRLDRLDRDLGSPDLGSADVEGPHR